MQLHFVDKNIFIHVGAGLEEAHRQEGLQDTDHPCLS